MQERDLQELQELREGLAGLRFSECGIGHEDLIFDPVKGEWVRKPECSKKVQCLEGACPHRYYNLLLGVTPTLELLCSVSDPLAQSMRRLVELGLLSPQEAEDDEKLYLQEIGIVSPLDGAVAAINYNRIVDGNDALLEEETAMRKRHTQAVRSLKSIRDRYVSRIDAVLNPAGTRVSLPVTS